MDQLRNSSPLDLQAISPMFLQASDCPNYRLDDHFRLADDSETSSIGIWLEMDRNLNALEDRHENKPSELEDMNIERIGSFQSSRISPTNVEHTSPEHNLTSLGTHVAPLRREARPSTHSGTVKYTTNLRALSPDGNIVQSEIIRNYEIPSDIIAEGPDVPTVDETHEHGIWLDGVKGHQGNESITNINFSTHLKISKTAEGSVMGSDISERENRPASSTIPLGASAVTPFGSPEATSNSQQEPSGTVDYLAEANQQDRMKQKRKETESQKEQQDIAKEEMGQEPDGKQTHDGLYALEQNVGDSSQNTVSREQETNKENLEGQITLDEKDDGRQRFERPNSQDYQTEPNALDDHGNLLEGFGLPPGDKARRVKPVDDSAQGTCTSSKITDASRSHIRKLHVLLKDTCKDLEEIQSGISQKDFRPCKPFIEHIDQIPNTLNNLIPTLEYSPYEEDLWKAHEGIVRVLEETKKKPPLIILHLLELGFYIFEVGTLLCEDLLPSCFAHLVHAILSRVQRLSAGRVVRQIIHVPKSFDPLVSTYCKDRRLERIENFCNCQIRLLEPTHPRSEFCPPDCRTLEVNFDPVRGKHVGFLDLLNRCVHPKRCVARIATTVLRRANGTESEIRGHELMQASQPRPRLLEVRADICAGPRQHLAGMRGATESEVLSKSAFV